MARFSGDVDDLHGSVGELRHFEFEETPNKVRVTSRDNYLRALGLIANLEDQRLDTIPTLQTLEWNSLTTREDGFGVTKIEDD